MGRGVGIWAVFGRVGGIVERMREFRIYMVAEMGCLPGEKPRSFYRGFLIPLILWGVGC